MNNIALIFLSFIIILISCSLTYFFTKSKKYKTLKYLPSLISLIGVLACGVFPSVFNYASGIAIGITFLFLTIFFGTAFIASVTTLLIIFLINKYKY